MQSFRTELRRRSLVFKMQNRLEGIVLNVHPENIRIILNNLIQNAIKYSTRGSTLIVGTLVQKYSFRLLIRNLGFSLGEGEPARIFEMSFRGQEARRGI